jgi:hypothetical protein
MAVFLIFCSVGLAEDAVCNPHPPASRTAPSVDDPHLANAEHWLRGEIDLMDAPVDHEIARHKK